MPFQDSPAKFYTIDMNNAYNQFVMKLMGLKIDPTQLKLYWVEADGPTHGFAYDLVLDNPILGKFRRGKQVGRFDRQLFQSVGDAQETLKRFLFPGESPTIAKVLDSWEPEPGARYHTRQIRGEILDSTGKVIGETTATLYTKL